VALLREEIKNGRASGWFIALFGARDLRARPLRFSP